MEGSRSGVVDIAPPILSRVFQEFSIGIVHCIDARKIALVPTWLRPGCRVARISSEGAGSRSEVPAGGGCEVPRRIGFLIFSPRGGVG